MSKTVTAIQIVATPIMLVLGLILVLAGYTWRGLKNIYNWTWNE